MYYPTEPFLSAELAYRRERIIAGYARPARTLARRWNWQARASAPRKVSHRLAPSH